MDIIYMDESYEIQKAIFEVYKVMGCGFSEAVYQECLEIEFRKNSIPYEAQKVLEINYKNDKLKQVYVPDFICFDKIIVEIKAVDQLSSIHKAQVINYLNITKMELGLLVNFANYPGAKIERLILAKNKKIK